MHNGGADPGLWPESRARTALKHDETRLIGRARVVGWAFVLVWLGIALQTRLTCSKAGQNGEE
jgi:hypothetical protein